MIKTISGDELLENGCAGHTTVYSAIVVEARPSTTDPEVSQYVLQQKHQESIHCISSINTIIIVQLGPTTQAGKLTTRGAKLNAATQINMVE